MAQFTQTKIGCTWLLNLLFLLIGLSLTTLAQTVHSTLYLNQTPTFIHYSLQQGLSNKIITAIHQDREGFIWVGTQDGLNRFDGYRFTVFQTDSTEMPYTFVSFIHEDRAGHLWLSTMNKGLVRFDKQTGKFTSYRIDSTGQDKRNFCLSILVDSQDRFWVATAEGVNKFDPETGRFTLYAHPAPGYIIYKIHEDATGGLWVATDKGLFQFDPDGRTFTLFPLSKEEQQEDISHVRCLYTDRKGNLWIGTNGRGNANGLFRLNPITRQITHYAFQKNGLTGNHIYKEAIVEDAAGMIWIGTNNGLQQLNPVTGEFTTYQANALIPGNLISNNIWSLYIDRSGLLWIGTAEGLHRLMPRSRQIRTYQLRPDAIYNHREENSIEFLYEDHSGLLWFSPFTHGLYSFDRRTSQLTRYAARTEDVYSLVNDNIRDVREDKSGVLWVLAGKCLHALDRNTGRFTRYPMQIYCWLLEEDSAGHLWVGGEALARFDKQSGQFTYYYHNPAVSNSLLQNSMFPMLISRSGVIWMGMAGLGLSKLEPKTGKFTHYKPNLTHPKGHLNNLLVNELYEDKAGILWIATTHGGLNRLDTNTGYFTAFTTRDGLPSNNIASILEDKRGHLWLSTNQGISRFNPRTRSFRNYDKGDGLQDNEFFGSVSFRCHNGELLFGGPNGFNIFHPGSLQDNPVIPPVYITSFKVLDKPHMFDQQTIKLSYLENFISFDFVALNYIMPEKNQYAYQLVGVDKDWVYSGNRRFVNYPDLDPGNYTFRVKASNNDGVWNQQGAALQFVILPPFYYTWWFISLSFAAVLCLLYAGYRYRIRQVQKQEREKTEFNKKVSELEMQALRAQMNPHFIFNCLNSINRFILKNQPEAASDYLSKFSRLIRLILQNSNTPTITLENELEALELYLQMEALRFEGKFTFSITCDKEVEADYIEIPPLIIQPYVENAIWHGLMHKEGMGQLSIVVQQEAQWLICTIEDNGIGRKRAAQLKSKSATKSKSMGMQITAHRLELLHKLYGKQTRVEVVDLIDDSGEACGTRVNLKMLV
ncbi:hypothetical protein GXP67_05715 [Rhodocytophaga rosea]|uniref:Histidine kinase n=1 Tax=Rhodocytophaga rosea TaxID=2704465 RepID=A0A6C0GE30_9BACT|nr:sensor histidine kinase [Rhodocytophaga rosea]QHT66198.1 hypothetical protein GXP67_05715 [Rhodocytophaga rosea]